VRSASHRGGSRPALSRPGVPEPEDSRIATSRGHRQGVSGAAAAGDGSRTSPVPCGTTCPCGPTDLPPTEGRTSWRAVNSLTRRWSAKMLHGCWRGSPPTTVYAVVKEPIRETASTAVATSPHRRPCRPTREVVTGILPGSYPTTSSILQVPGVTRGLSGGTDTRGVAPATRSRLSTGEAAPAALSGFHAITDRGSA
jgi:hypothetical protein